MHEENAARRYACAVTEMLDRAFSAQADRIEEAARIIADSLTQNGMLYTFGTGHAGLLAQEIFYRAGGPVRVHPIFDERLMLHVHASASSAWERESGLAEELMRSLPMKKGDVLLLISNSGRNTTPVEMAMLAREKGVHTICLTSVAHSSSETPRNPAGKRLMEVCDLVLDNMGVPGDAVVETGDGRRVSPTSTVIGAALLQAVSARAEEIARQEGKTLEYVISSNVDGGDAYNEKLIERYQKQVPCL